MNTNEEFYHPENYMTVAMVKEIMAEFTWPAPYEVEEDDELFNTINIKFPTCEIQFYNVPETGVHITFLTYNNGKELDADIRDIVSLDCFDNYPDENFEAVYTTSTDRIEQTIASVKSAIKWLQHYHMGFITGTDYSWVERYLERKE